MAPHRILQLPLHPDQLDKYPWQLNGWLARRAREHHGHGAINVHIQLSESKPDDLGVAVDTDAQLSRINLKSVFIWSELVAILSRSYSLDFWKGALWVNGASMLRY